jgi:hypothetical protein
LTSTILSRPPQAMSLAVDGLRRLLVRSFGKAEDLTALLVEPVPMILDPVLNLAVAERSSSWSILWTVYLAYGRADV